MSLQVWLPLNGNLNNQGLTNINAINNGATVNASGKIGSCYQFGTAASDITIPKEAMTSFTTEASICFWIKILTWNTSYATFFQAGPASTAWTAYIFGLLRNNANSTCCFTISNGSSASNASYLTPSLDLNIWYHISLIYKTGHCLIYINGQLYRDYTTSIVPNFSNITTIKLGRCTNGSSYQTNCQMNDFRIYNHALSVKEVEELSKGLKVHYKLDDKFCENTTNLITSITAGGQTTVSNNIVTTSGTNADTYFTLNLSENIAVDTQYTISCYAEMPGDTSWTFPLGTQSNLTLSWVLRPGYNTYTFTANNISWGTKRIFMDDLSGTARSSGVSCKFFNFQLEKKNHATGFAGYGVTRNSTTIYDSSGYGYNGTILNTLSIDSNSPKYDYSTKFNTTSSKIKLPDMNFSGMTNSYTFSWWQYNISTGNMAWGFSNGNRLNVYHCSPLCWNTGDGASNPFKDGSTTVTPASVQNAWHHMVVTGDGTTAKLYIDGVYKGSATTYKAITGTQIYISGWDTGTSYTFNGSKEVDFRIYCTALTAEQVKELYDTSVTIDKNGNVYAREVQEI